MILKEIEIFYGSLLSLTASIKTGHSLLMPWLVTSVRSLGSQSGLLWHVSRQHRLPVDWHHWRAAWKLCSQGGSREHWISNCLSRTGMVQKNPLLSSNPQVTVNPSQMVQESDFSNNEVRCDIRYTGSYVQARNCRITLWVSQFHGAFSPCAWVDITCGCKSSSLLSLFFNR